MEVQPRSKPDLRGLKMLVGFLGALVILGTALVIGVVIHRMYGKPAASAPGPIPGAQTLDLSTTLPPASNVLAPGEHIGGIASAGGKLVIWVTGPKGERVLLLDPATGKIAVAITTAP